MTEKELRKLIREELNKELNPNKPEDANVSEGVEVMTAMQALAVIPTFVALFLGAGGGKLIMDYINQNKKQVAMNLSKMPDEVKPMDLIKKADTNPMTDKVEQQLQKTIQPAVAEIRKRKMMEAKKA